MNTLSIGNDTIRSIAKQRLGYSGLAEILWIQARAEAAFLLQKRETFRSRKNDRACHAYERMGAEEFELINARQRWANWRTIPRNLHGLLEDRPVFAMDLCCGSGDSTEVLACYLPKGSRLLGLDFSAAFIERARRKRYAHRSGVPTETQFTVQSVLETFRDAKGEALPSGTVDVVNASGAVGCHFDEAASTKLAQEVSRVLKPGGLAMIDSGLPGTSTSLLVRIFKEQGFEMQRKTRSCLLDPYTQVCFVKKG